MGMQSTLLEPFAGMRASKVQKLLSRKIMVELEITTINVLSKQKPHGSTRLLSFLCLPDAFAALGRWEHMLIQRQPSPNFCLELHVKLAVVY